MNSDEISLGDIAFDPSTRRLRDKAGREVQLRNKSKAVLRYLVQNPGRTVTKAEILDAVWPDVTVSDESLVQCIADIRRVIGSDARQIVETVPREGYRITPGQRSSTKRRSRAVPLIAATVVLIAAWIMMPGTDSVPPPLEPGGTELRATATPPGTSVTEAYLEVLQGRVSADRFGKTESLVAERHFRRAIELDPAYARAYAELGTLFAVRFENDWTVLREADKQKALFFAERAVSLDPELWLAHYALGRLNSVFANLEEAASHLEKAMELQPGNDDARAYFGIVKNFQGEAETAVLILEPTVAAHPNPPYWYYLGLGHAHLQAGNFAKAEVALGKCLELAPDSPYCLRYLLAVLGSTLQTDRAREVASRYRSMGFDASVSSIMALMRFQDESGLARLEAAFRSAGLPE